MEWWTSVNYLWIFIEHGPVDVTHTNRYHSMFNSEKNVWNKQFYYVGDFFILFMKTLGHFWSVWKILSEKFNQFGSGAIFCLFIFLHFPRGQKNSQSQNVKKPFDRNSILLELEKRPFRHFSYIILWHIRQFSNMQIQLYCILICSLNRI